MPQELTKKSGSKGSNMKNLLTAILIFASASLSFGQTRSLLADISNIIVQPTNKITFGELDFKAPIKLQTRRNLGLGDDYLNGGLNTLSVNILKIGQTASEIRATNATIGFWNIGNEIATIGQSNFTLLAQGGALTFGPANTTGAAITRTNLALGATNDVNFGSLTLVGPLNFGNENRTGGSPGLLRMSVTNGQTIEFVTTGSVRATLGPIDFVLSQPNGALAFAPANTTGAAITRTNLQLASYVTNPIVPLANGGTGATNAGTAITNLGATTVGSSLFTAVNEAAARTTLQLAAYVTNPIVPLTNGGTGATNASGARTALELASYVTNPIVPLTNGGTGANTIGQARTNLGATVVGDAVFVAVDAAAARSAIGAIASTNNITGTASNVTGIVAITNGGTGANTASGARTNLEIGGGLNATRTFLAGTQTNTVTITNGIITSWTQSP